MEEILEKYFKESNMLYFQSSDSHKMIEGDTYLRLERKGKIQIWFGGDNGEVCLCSTTDHEKVKDIILAILK